MGIPGFHPFVNLKASRAIKKVHLSEYSWKRVAVDAFSVIFQLYHRSSSDHAKNFNLDRKAMLIEHFAHMIISFRRNFVQPIFILETPGAAPKEKKALQAKRRAKQEEEKDRVHTLRMALDKYHDCGEITEPLEKEMKSVTQRKGGPPSLISSKVLVNIPALENHYRKLESRLFMMDAEDWQNLEDLFRHFGVMMKKVDNCEAESYCAFLFRHKLVDAVLSSDSDVCAHGADLMYSREFNFYQDTVVLYQYSTILEELKMNDQEFVDMCILSGTDYGEKIKGIAIKTAHQLIEQHRLIDKLPSKYDVTPLDHVNRRTLFRQEFEDPKETIHLLPYSKPEEIHNFLFKKNTRIKFETIKKAFEAAELVFED